MNPHIFRKYDIRGVVGRDLTEELVVAIGRSFGSLVHRSGGRRIAVGRDCRLSSPALVDALAQGMTKSGIDVVDLGMVPTPVLYFADQKLATDAAVQVTGSHNPPDYNGLKMIAGGQAVFGTEIQKIRKTLEASDFVEGAGERSEYTKAVDDYVEWIVERAQLADRRLKVVVDAGNGAGGPTILKLFEALGIETVPIFCEPDGTFPNHHPDPTVAEALESLRERVLAEGADFGVGLDGDADRIGVIDGRGQILWGDKLMIILARDLLRQEPGCTVVAEVKCSQTLFDDIRAHGGEAVMYKVGHSLIKAKMKESGALLAGEMSGHIFFKHRFFGFDDAIYTATRLAEIVSRSDRELADYLDGVPETFATPEIRIDAGDDAIKFEAARAVAESYRDPAAEGIREIITIDGVRVVFEDGWGLIRASNTQPVLVMRAEATTEARRDEIEAALRERIERAISEASAR